ncbi:hypothetical protein VTI74DRAFT_10190 [Chaetomium olivicolor]
MTRSRRPLTSHAGEVFLVVGFNGLHVTCSPIAEPQRESSASCSIPLFCCTFCLLAGLPNATHQSIHGVSRHFPSIPLLPCSTMLVYYSNTNIFTYITLRRINAHLGRAIPRIARKRAQVDKPLISNSGAGSPGVPSTGGSAMGWPYSVHVQPLAAGQWPKRQA